jgi:predicted esterase
VAPPDTSAPPDSAYLRATLAAAHAARQALLALEETSERLAPLRLHYLAADVEQRCGKALQAARAALDAAPVPTEMQPLATKFGEGFSAVERAVELFTAAAEAFPPESMQRILGAWHYGARAQEALYALRRVLPPFHTFWDLPDIQLPDPPRSAAAEHVGLVHVSSGAHHGGFSLYVPEHYSADRDWPVIIALHGGFGNGRDFLWTWLREARSLGYLLVAPSAVQQTWSDVEERGLLEILAWLRQRYRVAGDRVLLTGLSDGATFALLYGLAHPDVFRAIAALCGVLHPAHAMLGNLERAKGVPIYLVHGELDFMFPVMTARMAQATLRDAGAALTYREIADLSHTYPRSENVRILDWFAALPHQ